MNRKNFKKTELDTASVLYKLQRQEQIILKMIDKMKDQSSKISELETALNNVLKDI